MFFEDSFVADHARRRGSAGPLGNKILRDVFRANPIDKDQTQKILKISSNTQRRIERAALFIDRPTAIERRVGRHESQPHQIPTEDPRRVVSDTMGQIVVIDIMNIALDSIHIGIGQSLGDMFKHVVRRIKIIRIEFRSPSGSSCSWHRSFPCPARSSITYTPRNEAHSNG